MVTYADPSSCPVCRSRLTGNQRCHACGFDLQSAEASELWGIFQRADAVIARVRPTTPVHAPVATPAASDPNVNPTVPVATAGAPLAPPVHPAAAVPTAPRRSVSGGSILLGLGALLLLVAAAIFLTVAWGALGIAGRAAVLLVVTAMFFAFARWAERRSLRGSAEALWSVFLGLVTLDWFVARGEGLLGLDALAWSVVAAVWSVGLVGFALWRRGVIVAQVVAGITTWIVASLFVIDLLDRADWTPFWALVPATLFVAAILVLGLVQGRTLLAVCASPALAVGVAGLIIAAFLEVLRDAAWVTLTEAAPLLVLIAVAAGLCLVRPVRAVAAGVASVGLQWLGFHAATGWSIELDQGADPGVLGLVVVVAVSALLGRQRDGEPQVAWTSVRTGLRGAAAAGSLVLAAASSEMLDPWWLAAPCWFAIAVTAWSFRVLPAAWTSAAIGVVVASITVADPFPTDPTDLALLCGVLASCAAAILLARLLRAEAPLWGAAPVVLAVAVTVIAPDTGWVLVAAGVALAVIALVTVHQQVWSSAVAAGLVLPIVVLGVASDLESRTTLSDDWIAIVGTAIAAVVLLVVMALDAWPWHRRAIELGAAGTFVMALTQASGPGWAAAHFTALGVAAVVVAFLDDDEFHRSWMRWIGAGALAVAYVLRLVASEIDVVEAYTAPFGLVALGAGLVAMRRDGDLRTWSALTPALGLLLLPSLPLALDDPTSLRALLLGLGALVAVGVGVTLRWGAPLVTGAVVLALVVIANLGPVADAVPRWMVIAVAGTLLMVVGLTWEKWVKEGKAVVARVTAMR